MNKEEINSSIQNALSKVNDAISILRETERSFNDTLTDKNGRNIEREFYAVYNALKGLEDAKQELTANK